MQPGELQWAEGKSPSVQTRKGKMVWRSLFFTVCETWRTTAECSWRPQTCDGSYPGNHGKPPQTGTHDSVWIAKREDRGICTAFPRRRRGRKNWGSYQDASVHDSVLLQDFILITRLFGLGTRRLHVICQHIGGHRALEMGESLGREWCESTSSQPGC